jgi:hypothetical protein
VTNTHNANAHRIVVDALQKLKHNNSKHTAPKAVCFFCLKLALTDHLFYTHRTFFKTRQRTCQHFSRDSVANLGTAAFIGESTWVELFRGWGGSPKNAAAKFLEIP